MKALRSFYCPIMQRAFRLGADYSCPDPAHVEKLIKAGIIEAPTETRSTRKRGKVQDEGGQVDQ